MRHEPTGDGEKPTPSLPRRILAQLRANYDNRHWWRSVVVGSYGVGLVHSLVADTGAAVRVMAEDWDTLVVLDACRADLFEETFDPGAFDAYEVVESGGSTTAEWVGRNFAGGSFGDTVYVTANPFVSTLAGGAFHRVVDVWRYAFDEAARTIRPEPVVDAALRAHEAHPEKRLVVHFMQPHMPFVGSDAVQYGGWAPEEMTAHAVPSGRPRDPWEALEMGLVDREEVWRAYRDNLDYVLDHVDPLVGSLDGKTVVTSDHGNLLGERCWPLPVRLYGHPGRVRHPALVTVPWATVTRGQRRTVTAGEPSTAADYGRAELEETLAALGYRG